jgi:hypothetical protein
VPQQDIGKPAALDAASIIAESGITTVRITGAVPGLTAGSRTSSQMIRIGWLPFPIWNDEAAGDRRGAAIFTRRGDYLATGWLSSYQHIE